MEKVIMDEIEQISKEFAKPFEEAIGGIAGSGWLIADPLSAYLMMCGYKHTVKEIPQTKDRPQILLFMFEDGTLFIPAGSDLGSEGANDWMWVTTDQVLQYKK